MRVFIKESGDFSPSSTSTLLSAVIQIILLSYKSVQKHAPFTMTPLFRLMLQHPQHWFWLKREVKGSWENNPTARFILLSFQSYHFCETLLLEQGSSIIEVYSVPNDSVLSHHLYHFRRSDGIWNDSAQLLTIHSVVMQTWGWQGKRLGEPKWKAPLPWIKDAFLWVWTPMEALVVHISMIRTYTVYL